MQIIKLYGHLGKRFGREFKISVRTAAEAIAALNANLDGFAAYINKHSEPGYHILIDKLSIGASKLHAQLEGEVIKIIPSVAGAKHGGVLQTVIGAVMLVAGIFTANPYLISAGVSMLAGGVIALLTHAPKLGSQEDPNNQPSYAFNGPINTAAQGNAVTVVYGKSMVGSQVVSFGLSADDFYGQ